MARADINRENNRESWISQAFTCVCLAGTVLLTSAIYDYCRGKRKQHRDRRANIEDRVTATEGRVEDLTVGRDEIMEKVRRVDHRVTAMEFISSSHSVSRLLTRIQELEAKVGVITKHTDVPAHYEEPVQTGTNPLNSHCDGPQQSSTIEDKEKYLERLENNLKDRQHIYCSLFTYKTPRLYLEYNMAKEAEGSRAARDLGVTPWDLQHIFRVDSHCDGARDKNGKVMWDFMKMWKKTLKDQTNLDN